MTSLGTPNWIIQVSSTATRRKFVVNKQCCRICYVLMVCKSHMFWWIAVQRKFLKNIFLWMKITIKKQYLKKLHLNQIQRIRTSKKPKKKKHWPNLQDTYPRQGVHTIPWKRSIPKKSRWIAKYDVFLRKRLDGFLFKMASFSSMAASFSLKIPVGISFLNTSQSQDTYI